MSTKSIILSYSGLRNIITYKESKEDYFTFVSGEQTIQMPRIFAEFFSPRVSHIHRSDPTIDHLDFTEFLSSIKSDTTRFENLLDEDARASLDRMIRGERIEISGSNESKLRQISVLLGNEELFNAISEARENGSEKERTIEERIDEILLYSEIAGTSFSIESTKLIDDIASNISIKDISQMKNVPRKILYAIISNEHFKSSDEDALIDFINEIFADSQNGNGNGEEVSDIEFYETVDLKNLSEDKFREFLSKLDFTKMTGSLWSRLCECFFTKRVNKNLFEYDGDTSHRFSGIINHLRGNMKTNISDEGIISVTASSTENPHQAKYAVDFDNEEFFHSSGRGDWLQIDFKDKKIRPTHYSIKTPRNHDNDGDQQFPVNWCIEVSNTGEGNDWRAIDTRQNVTSISKRNQSDTFSIGTHLSSDEFYRFVRLRSTGRTSGNCSNIIFSSLEFFGELSK